MLNGIHLVDFGNHRDTRLTFGRMTALVGQNGAGKTNVMRAIMELDRRRSAKTSDDRPVREDTRKGAKKWMILASWPDTFVNHDGTWGLEITLGALNRTFWREGGGLEKGKWIPDPFSEPGEMEIGIYAKGFRGHRGPRLSSELQAEKIYISEVMPSNEWSSSYFKTAGSFLQEPSYSDSLPPTLGEDCRALAWMIAYLKGDKDEIFDAIVTSIREVVPVFRRVRHRPVAMQRLEKKSIVFNNQERSFDEEQKVMGQELRFDMASGSDLPASAISEGTLVTLAILTAIMQDGAVGSSQTILLDDIESGLHPRAQRDLIKQLRKLQETRPELQIIFSSHSPYIIDEMAPEDVWIFAADEEGIAHSARLSDHPDAKRAMGALTTGEFWGAEGDAWVLDPAKAGQLEAEPATVG